MSEPGQGFEDLARAALLEVTDARSIGPLVSEEPEGDGVVTLRFESNLPGYLGWKWTVSVAKIGDAEPTVLESELMPGAGALLAPEWVPWSDRLEEYNAARAAAEAESEGDDADDDDLVDDEDLDELDVDYDGPEAEAVLDDEDEDEDDEDDEDGDDFDDSDDDADDDSDEDDSDEDDSDDDFEEDPAESDPTAGGVGEPEQAQGDAGGAGPDEAGILGADESAETEQQADERD